MPNLYVIYQDWGEFNKLGELANLEELLFVNNPIQLKSKEDGDWTDRVAKICASLKKLDGLPVLRDD